MGFSDVISWAGRGQEPRPLARPLIPATLALMAGIAAPAWGVSLPAWMLLGGMAVLGPALALFWRLDRPVRLLPLAFFWLVGMAFCQQAWQPVFPPHHVAHLPQDRTLSMSGYLDRPGRIGPERAQLFLEAEAWLSPEGWRPATGKLLVLALPLDLPTVGTRVVVKGRLRTPLRLKNPGTFDRSRHLAADGIFRELRVRDSHDLVVLAAAVTPMRERLRGGIRRLLKELPPELGAIYLAMLLGDQGEITPEIRQALARTGTSHLLVVNGLHLGMVAAAIYFLTLVLLRQWGWLLLRVNALKIATLGAAAAVAGYAWVAGGSPSTQRAEIMVLAYLLLVFLGRPRELWSALALAALVILSLNPLRLFFISFQLSFAAVAALIYLIPYMPKELLPNYESPDFLERNVDRIKRIPYRLKQWALISVAASLATAPLVALYFQVVSVLGVVVNLAAIPLVLGLALPLGEAGVLAQALSLTPVAQALLAVGQWPLWLGYQAITWTAQLPASAIIAPIPTWFQIALYYVILALVFAPRRTFWTWTGAGLAGLALVCSVALPLWLAPQALEVTCLDTRGDLAGVAVAPEGRRLVFSAPAASWGRQGGGWGALPGYLHWRQFHCLDQVAALTLSRDNGQELLTLCRQFDVGAVWFGRRGPQGPPSWSLWNFLGDLGRPPRSLERGPPPASLGGAGLKFLPLGEDQEPALLLTYKDRRALIIPPLKGLEIKDAAGLPQGVEVLIVPQALLSSQGQSLAALVQPRRWVIYGGSRRRSGREPGYRPPDHAGYFTQEGAVSVFLDENGSWVRQWRP